MGEAKGLMAEGVGVRGGGDDRWDSEQAELVGAIISVAQQRSVYRRRFWHGWAGSPSTNGGGPCLDRQAGRLAASVASVLVMKCSGVQDLAALVKRSLPLTYLAGAIRLRGLW